MIPYRCGDRACRGLAFMVDHGAPGGIEYDRLRCAACGRTWRVSSRHAPPDATGLEAAL